MSIDYSVLDHFCKVPTWNTFHGHDERRLKEALMEIMYSPDFDPFFAVDYVRQNHGNTTWAVSEEQMEQVFTRLLNKVVALWSDRHQWRAR